jgi:1,4-alpha-glucan branching enzyme
MTRKSQKKCITFQYDTLDEGNVSVAGSFNDWDIFSHPLKRSHNGNGNGRWQRAIYLEPGIYEYRFVMDGVWHDDPRCAERRGNDFGIENCVLII